MADMRQLAAVAVFGGCMAAMQGASLCDVTSYGAKNDGSARSTGAIRAAIQACAKAGGECPGRLGRPQSSDFIGQP